MSILYKKLRLKFYPYNLKAFVFIVYILLVGSNKIYAINVDDQRDNPLNVPSGLESIVYIKTGNIICTGTLINHRTILTEAHCFNDSQQAQILLGDNVEGLNQRSICLQRDEPGAIIIGRCAQSVQRARLSQQQDPVENS